ncbi:MAG: hypothetical protein Kow0042_24380 [Calditrichia bacterium]
MTKELFLNLSLPGWIFFIIAWIFFFLALFYYRKTLPPLSRYRRWFLILIRSLTLIIVLFILLQPILTLILEHQDPPLVAVLVDNSRSMLIEDGSGIRADSVRFLLNHINGDNFSDSLQFRLFRFDRQLRSFQFDSLTFEGKQTNISRALQEVADSLSENNLQAVVLISDGQFNQGPSPLRIAERMPVPVYTIAVGDSVSRRDVRLSGVQANPVGYVGQELPVSVRILHSGYDNKTVTIQLKQGKQTVAAQKITLSSSGFEQKVDFALKAEQPGEIRYTIEVESFPDEITRDNNRSSFVVKILKSKIRALLLSGVPTFDQRLLIHTIRQLPDVQLTILTEKSPGAYYEARFPTVHLDSQDVFIFLGFPTRYSDSNQLKQILGVIQKSQTPLYLFLNRYSDLKKLSAWQSILPVNVNSPLIEEGNVWVQLTTGGRLHPVTRLDDNPQRLSMLWNDLPPLTAFGRRLIPEKGSQVLVEYPGSDGKSEYPLLIAGIQQNTKVLVFAGAQFGGWHFQLQDDPNRDRFFKMFTERSLKWLVNREDIQRIQIHPVQKVFHAGEPITFSGQVLDEFYQRVNDAVVEIQIVGENVDQRDVLSGADGFYNYQASGLPRGSYTYRLVAEKGDRRLGEAEGKFVVESLELEMQEPEANPALMRAIALRSGGQYWKVREFSDKMKMLHFDTRTRFTTVEHILWSKFYWLIILLIFLSVEWFFRKRWGLL